MHKVVCFLCLIGIQCLMAACENEGKEILDEINSFYEWSFDTKPHYATPGDIRPISSNTLAAIVKMENEFSETDLKNNENNEDFKIIAIIDFEDNRYTLTDRDIERLYYIAQAQIYEKFEIKIVSEGAISETLEVIELIQAKLLSYEVDPSYIQINYENFHRDDFLRVKILK